MHMAERQWAQAATDFFDAFKNYDEAGTHRRIQCLKYVCLLAIHVSWSRRSRTFCTSYIHLTLVLVRNTLI